MIGIPSPRSALRGEDRPVKVSYRDMTPGQEPVRYCWAGHEVYMAPKGRTILEFDCDSAGLICVTLDNGVVERVRA